MKQLNLGEMFKTYLERKPIFKEKDVLTERYIPERIIHRDEEIGQVARVLAPALKGQKVSNLFLFGTVGTGKSVSLLYVADEMKKASERVEILYMNCKMKKVSDTEYRLLAELTRMLGQFVPSTGLPTDDVYKMFFDALDKREKNVILILDEVDALVRRVGDDLLYNLTRTNLKSTKLSIVGISNDVNFLDNLDPRVKSSLSEEELIFPPYNATQIKDILINRCGKAFMPGTIDDSAISKCAAFAAQEHGDARKALDLIRIAGELVERDGGERITTDYIDRAEDKLDMDRAVTVVRSQPKQSQAVLSGIILLSEKGEKDMQTGDIFTEYENICKRNNMKTLTQRRVSDLIAELDMLGIINARVISKGRYGRTREIRLSVGDAVLSRIRKSLEDNYLLEKIV